MGCSRANPEFLGVQFTWRCSSSVAAYSFVVTLVILKVINLLRPVRVPDEVEMKGLDSQLHGETRTRSTDDIGRRRPHSDQRGALMRAARGRSRKGAAPPSRVRSCAR